MNQEDEKPIRVLYVDDYALDRELVCHALERESHDFAVSVAASHGEFERLFEEGAYDIVLSDFNILGFEGFQVIEAVHRKDPDVPVMIITGTGSEEIAIQAMRMGATDYVIKTPEHIQRLPQSILTALERRRLHEDRVNAEAKLKESEEQYRALYENAPNAYFTIRIADGTILRANREAHRMLGYGEGMLTGEPILPFCVEGSQGLSRAEEIMRKCGRGETVRDVEVQMKGQEGQIRWVSMTAEPATGSDGSLTKIHAIAVDVSERRSVEDQLRQSQKMEAMGNLAGGIAHDFNNILSIIIGNIELLGEGVSQDSSLFEYIEEAIEAGRRGAALTGQILAFSRKQAIELRAFDLNRLLSDAKSMLSRLIPEDIEIRTVLSKETVPIEADPFQLEQVLMNLAVNARDAMPEGGELCLETGVIELDPAYAVKKLELSAGRYATLSVSDTGVGMDAATVDRAFEPFFTKKGARGTGLGLSTVYGIVKQHGGHVWAYSEPGKGTTLHVYLPEASGTAAVEAAPSRPKAAPVGSATILVVEDDAAVRRLVCKILKRNGYNVLEADTPDAAIGISRAFSEEIHLLLTDVVMPGLSGPAVYAQILAIHPESRVLYMSGYTTGIISRHGVEKGSSELIEKPISVDLLLGKVGSSLSGQ